MNANDKNERALDLALGVSDAAAEAEALRDPQLDAARRAWDRRLARLAAAASSCCAWRRAPSCRATSIRTPRRA